MTERNKRRGFGLFLGGSKSNETERRTDPLISDSSRNSFSDASPEPTPEVYRDIAATEYAVRRRELMQLITGLRMKGAHQLIKIPRIAVIGIQSAGKSSVVEAVTGITVPRDSGTCTRCPMECTMSSSATTWACQISLRYEYDEAGVKMSVTQHTFSPVLTDRGQVELWIRRAQVAILSLHRTLTDCQNLSEDQVKDIQKNFPKGDRSMLQFSKNFVCVDIKDPDATDISFVDLPGLVQNLDVGVVDLVENLTISAIEDDSAIILVTMPLTDEMENQLAFRLAREADPEGKRTVGVLTKPDKIQAGDLGARQRWKDVISGKAHPLNHGYYCLRLPDDGERAQSITRAQGEEISNTYFASNTPWNELGPAGRRRLGVANLVSDVSQLLMRLLEEALPRIREEISSLLSECNADIAALPAAPETDNATTTVILKVSKFTSDLSMMVYGRGDMTRDFIQRNQANYGVLRRKIRGTAPDFRPYHDRKQRSRPLYPGDEDGDPDPLVQPLDLSEVRYILKKHIGWELPDHIPFEATKEMLDSSIKLWDVPTRTCFQSAYMTLTNMVDNLIMDHFQQLTQFENLVGQLAHEKLAEIWASASKEIEKALARERDPLWSQNDHYFSAAKSKWLGIYKSKRHEPWFSEADLPSRAVTPSSEPASQQPSPQPHFRSMPSQLGGLGGFGQQPSAPMPAPTGKWGTSKSVETHRTQALQALAVLGYHGITAADFHRLYPADEYEEELKVMAGVRAHFQVAYKRIIDQVPLTIEHSMSQPFADGLHAALLGVLDVGSKEKMEALLSEDPAIAKRREELNETKARLMDIQAHLESFVL